MRISEGVEWALHSCLNLAWVGPERSVPAAKLAALYDLPTAYLNKQLQALARAGILTSTPGPRGGFRLARPPGRISLLDVVVAIEGAEDAFRCTQILRSAPDGDPATDYRTSCLISQAMHRADLAWRKELAGQTIADLETRVKRTNPRAPQSTRQWLTEPASPGARPAKRGADRPQVR